MYEVTVETSFSAAHWLRNYRGKCENLHGHNWKVAVSVVSDTLKEEGFVIDFKELRELTNTVLKGLDHECLNELPQFKETNPTSENIASALFKELKPLVEERGVKLRQVKVWESEDSSVSFGEER